MRRLSSPLFFQTNTTLIEDTKTPTQKRLNQYYLTDRIGRGASSKVYLGVDETGARYAIKCVDNNTPAGFGVLERELRIMKKLNHPNIIKLIEALWAPKQKRAYLVLELANCLSLQTHISEQFPFTLQDIASLVYQVCQAYSYLVKQDIVHRDIKPGNILLFSDGSAKLSDFGIGHSFQSADAIVGTPAYQAPEVFDDENEDQEVDPFKEDVWSFGISLFETIYGYLPFDGQNIYEIAMNAHSTPIQLPDLPDDLKSLMEGMLQIDPAKRFSFGDIAQHPFVANALPKIPSKLIQIPHHQPNLKIPLTHIDGCTIDESFNFSKYERAQMWRSNEDDSSPVFQQMSSSLSMM